MCTEGTLTSCNGEKFPVSTSAKGARLQVLGVSFLAALLPLHWGQEACGRAEGLLERPRWE